MVFGFGVWVNLLPEGSFLGCLVVVSFSVLVVFRFLCFGLVLISLS